MARSQTEKMWLFGGGVVGLVAIVIGWFFFISPQRAQTSDVNGQADSARLQNARLQTRIAALRAENANLGKYRAQLAGAQRALPSTSGLSDFLRTLQSIGSATLTNVTSLAVGPPTDVSQIAATGVNPAAQPSSSSSASPTASPTSPTAAAPAPGAASAVPAGGPVYGLTITAQATGTPDSLNRFLAQLQSVQPRAVLISQLNEASSAAAGKASGPAATTTLQLTMQAFVAPVDPAENAQLAAASHK